MLSRLRLVVDRIGRWFGGYDLAVLIGLQVLALALWLFLLVAQEVARGDTRSLDERLILALRRPGDPSVPIGPPWLEEVGRDLTALGGMAITGLTVAAVCGFLLIRGKRHAVALIVAATGGAFALALLTKHGFSRPRPELVPHLSLVMTSSFPSGHTVMSAAIYLTLGSLLARLAPGAWLKVYCIGVAVVVTGLVGVSRVYLGVHWPTDVLAGWALGLSWAIACWVIARALQRRGKVEERT